MKDTLYCPICKVRMTSRKINWIINGVHQGPTTSRLCPGFGHFVTMYIQKKQVVLLKVSLNSQYTRQIEIDYRFQTSKIIYDYNTISVFIHIPKLLVPDFPNLTELKEKVDILLAFQ